MKQTEAVSEMEDKRQADRQWQRHSEQSGDNSPSARQLAFIAKLSQRVGRQVDVRSITSKRAASGTITELLELGLHSGGNGASVAPNGATRANSSAYDERDRRIAFGMATKLVYAKYAAQGRRLNDEFWPEVRSLYSAYQSEQERAVRSAPLFVSAGGAA